MQTSMFCPLRPIITRSFLALALVTLVSCLPMDENNGLMCTAIAAVGIQVTVRDAHDDRVVCDAQVLAIDGEYTETLNPWPTGDECSYAGVYNRVGTYQIDVVHPDFAVATTTATVTATGPCPADIDSANVSMKLTSIEAALHGGVRAIFAVAGEEFRTWITNAQTIDDLLELKDGNSDATIPSGRIQRGPGEGNHNWPYSWHLDPDDTEMAELTMELCDALPSYVEENVDEFVEVVQRYCPWSAELIDLEDFR